MLHTVSFLLSQQPQFCLLHLVFPLTFNLVCKGVYIFLFSGIFGSDKSSWTLFPHWHAKTVKQHSQDNPLPSQDLLQHMLLTWENVSTKLLWCLTQETVLSSVVYYIFWLTYFFLYVTRLFQQCIIKDTTRSCRISSEKISSSNAESLITNLYLPCLNA